MIFNDPLSSAYVTIAFLLSFIIVFTTIFTYEKPVKVPTEKNTYKHLNNNLNGDGFYNKLVAMHNMKLHHAHCNEVLSSTDLKMKLSLDEIIKIRKYIRTADHRMRKYMKKAAPHPCGEILRYIYYNYDNTKIYAPDPVPTS